MKNELVKIQAGGGFNVACDADGMVSLTELWRAAGEDKDKKPNDWMATQAATEFVAALAQKLNAEKSAIAKSRRGRHLGGTWAHWQVALAYAKWLSPEFHIHVNEAYVRWAEEENSPALKIDRGLNAYKKRGKSDEWIMARVKAKLGRLKATSVWKDHGVCNDGRVNGFAEITNINTLTATGLTVNEFRQARGLSSDKTREPTRDAMSSFELASIESTEAATTDLIQAKRAYGNSECIACARDMKAVLGPAFARARAMIQGQAKAIA